MLTRALLSLCLLTLSTAALAAPDAEQPGLLRVVSPGVVSAELDGEPLGEVLFALADAASVSLLLPAGVDLNGLEVSAHLRGVSAEATLLQLLEQHGFKHHVVELSPGKGVVVEGGLELAAFFRAAKLRHAEEEVKLLHLKLERLRLKRELDREQRKERGKGKDEDEDEDD